MRFQQAAADGLAVFERVPAGAYRAFVAVQTVQQVFVAADAGQVEVTLELPPPRVVAADGTALPSMQVLLWCRAGHWNGLFPVTSADGSFRVGPFPPGRYALETHDNLNAVPPVTVEPFELARGASYDVGTLRPVTPCSLRVRVDSRALAPGTRVNGRVLDRSGGFVANLRIESEDEPEWFVPSSVLPAGDYRVALDGRGVHPLDQAVSLQPGPPTRITMVPESGSAQPIRTEATGDLRLRITAADGVVVDRWYPGTHSGTVRTLFLKPGRYTVKVTAADGRSGSAELTVTTSPAAERTIRLR